MSKNISSLKKLIADVNTDEILYHIGHSTLSAWCSVWTQAAKEALGEFEGEPQTQLSFQNTVRFFEDEEGSPLLTLNNVTVPQLGSTAFLSGGEYKVTGITYGYDNKNSYTLIDVFVEECYDESY